MINYHDALALIEKVATTHSSQVETVKLSDSLGRILCADLLSSEVIPSFNNSAMDGFAVFAADTAGATSVSPLRIPVNGMVAAGDLKALKMCSDLGKGVAVEIMTGAPVPTGGLDAVVKIEDVKVERVDDGRAVAIHILKPVKVGDNIRPIGTDYKIGQLVIPSGTRIAPEHILAASSLGIANVSVKKWPKIAIICTGSELVPPETPVLEPGMIRNSTGPYLAATLRSMGLDAKYLGVVRDDPALYHQTLERALAEGVEIILSTGAVSMGQFDFVSDVLKKMGATIHFHKAAIRPGKPILFSQLKCEYGNAVIFGVPGNPISTAVGLRFFVEPYIRKYFGLASEKPLQIKLGHEFSKPEGLRCFFKGRAGITDLGLEVEALKNQASYVVSSFVEANCWVVFPEARGKIAAGTVVDVYPLNHSFELGVLS